MWVRAFSAQPPSNPAGIFQCTGLSTNCAAFLAEDFQYRPGVAATGNIDCDCASKGPADKRNLVKRYRFLSLQVCNTRIR